MAVADVPGRTAFTVVPGRPSRSGISATLDLASDAAVVEVEAEVTTLDEALPADYQPALVKVDVEGGELEVLLGAQRVLAERKPVLALEHQYGRRTDRAKTLRIFDLVDGLATSGVPSAATTWIATSSPTWSQHARSGTSSPTPRPDRRRAASGRRCVRRRGLAPDHRVHVALPDAGLVRGPDR